MQIDQKLLDEIADKVTDGIKSLGGLKGEVRSQLRSGVESVFRELDVVTGDQMAVQKALLAEVQGRLKLLEDRLLELEGSGKKK